MSDPARRRDYHQEWLRRQRKTSDESPRRPPPPTPSPANIVLSDFSISPQQIQLGSSATVSVTATNHGGSVGSKTIAMLGDFIQSQPVTLSPGASTIVRFTVTPDKIGAFSVTVGRFTGSFSVSARRRQPTQPVPTPTKPTRRLPVSAKWFGGILVLAIAIGLAAQFWPMSAPTTEPTPSPTSAATGGFKTYTDTANGFSISYPDNWDQIPSELLKATLGDMGVVGFWPPVFQPDNYSPSFHILLEELPFTMGVDTYWDSAKRYLPNLFGNYTALSTESATINGIPAIVHVFTFTDSGNDGESWQCKFIKVALVKDSGAWIITCESTVPYFDDYKPTFDAAIKSFRFLD